MLRGIISGVVAVAAAMCIVTAYAGEPSPTPTPAPSPSRTPVSVSPPGATGSFIIRASLRVERGEFGAQDIPAGTLVRVEDGDELCMEFVLDAATVGRLNAEGFAEIGTIELPSKDGEPVCGENGATLVLAVVFPSGSYLPFLIGPWTEGEVSQTFTIHAPIPQPAAAQTTVIEGLQAPRPSALPSTGSHASATAMPLIAMTLLAGVLALATAYVVRSRQPVRR